MTKADYAPLPRIVVELSRPVILGVYVNGELTEIPATLEFHDRAGRLSVVFTEGAHPALKQFGIGSAPEIEVRMIDDE